MATNVTVGGNSFQTANIITSDILHEGGLTIDAKIYPIAHANLSGQPFVSYPQRTVTLKGKLVDSSISALDTDIDNFKAFLNQPLLPILIDYNGNSLSRKYIGTANKIDIQRPGGLLFANYSVDFICPYPFGMNTSQTAALTATGRTLSSYIDAYTFLGSAPVQWPVATYTFNSLTTSATNLLTNPGFETAALTPWATIGVGTPSVVTTLPNSGTYCCKVVNASSAVGGYYGGVLQLISSTTIGSTYNIGVWLKGAAGGEVVVINSENGTGSTTVTLTTTWTQYWVTVTDLFASLFLNISSTTASATWYIDDAATTINVAATVSFGNNANGQQINVNRVWSIGDVLTVDVTQLAGTATNPVSVNGAAVAFSGAFPEFAPGAQNLYYGDSFLTRNFNASVMYTPMWM